MKGIIRRDKHSIPFWAIPPKMTPEYKSAMDDLFFSQNISSIEHGDTIVSLGSPIVIKEQVYTIGSLPLDDSNIVVVSGGHSPAYKRFGPEFVGAAAIEIFKGTFAFDLKEAESFRVQKRLYEKFPYTIINNIIWECDLEGYDSSNAYESIANSWELLKVYNPKMRRVVLATTIEDIPRAIETFRTIAGLSVEVRGLPYNPDVADKWHKNIYWRGRFASEAAKLSAFSDENNTRIKNPIKLLPETRMKLEKALGYLKYRSQKDKSRD
ncbi:MAG: hypothetical protein LBL21_04095 [Rickettsiales bacterium]|jgi:hypothetical protein|nr:hypothetical protein [Rickettsiales bacterium]